MLLGQARTAHGDAAVVEVERDLPVRAVDNGLPGDFVAVRPVDNKKEAVWSGKWRVES